MNVPVKPESDASEAEITSVPSNGPRRSPDQQQRIEAAVRELFEHKITFNEFLGFHVDSLSPDDVRIGFSMRPELVGHYLYGRLHGGVISAVLDATGGLAVMWAMAEYFKHESANAVMERFAMLGTVDLRIDYLRQGIGERFAASARIVRLGRRIASTQMELHNDQARLIATGAATYIVS